MLKRLDDIENKFNEIEQQLADPGVTADMNKYRKLTQEHSELKEIVDVYREYKKINDSITEAKEILDDADSDKEMKELAQAELDEHADKLEPLEEELKMLLVPKDPDDNKDAILEIRQGTGGEEAAIFAGNLFEMYKRYCEAKGWKIEIASMSEADQGGIREVIATLSGEGVYGRMKYESGTHRVQRVPKTESQGRVHTSAATVAIIPEAEDIDVEIKLDDLRIDTYRASGAGGQHINKTDSAVRITHLPTNTVVACQDGRSQHANKDTAMRLLKSKIYEQMEKERMKKEKDMRKMQVGSGDRSEKIRTYNYPQSRVTDHRIGLTLHSLDQVMLGSLDEIIDALIMADRIAKLKGEA